MHIKTPSRRNLLKSFIYVVNIPFAFKFLKANAQTKNKENEEIQNVLNNAAQTVSKRQNIMGLQIVPDTRAGFGVDGVEKAILALTKESKLPQISNLINLQKVANPAPDGRRVPISIDTSLINVKTIAIFFDKNPNNLAAVYNLENGALASIEIPIKMRENGNIYVLVKSGSEWFYQKKAVRVLLGGCS